MGGCAKTSMGTLVVTRAWKTSGTDRISVLSGRTNRAHGTTHIIRSGASRTKRTRGTVCTHGKRVEGTRERFCGASGRTLPPGWAAFGVSCCHHHRHSHQQYDCGGMEHDREDRVLSLVGGVIGGTACVIAIVIGMLDQSYKRLISLVCEFKAHFWYI